MNELRGTFGDASAMQRLRLVAIPALAFALASATLFGQATSQIQGVVTDQAGRAVPEADVKARQTDTGVERTASTGSDGIYIFTNLPIGPYQIAVTKTGF